MTPRRRSRDIVWIALVAAALAVPAAIADEAGTAGVKQKATKALKKAKKANRTAKKALNKADQPGPAGPAGPPGPKGDTGNPGRSALSTLQSGETIYGTIGDVANALGANEETASNASFPIPTSVALDDAHVSVDGSDEAADECTGSATNPTAPAGYVCIYPFFTGNLAAGYPDGHIWGPDATAGEKWGFQMNWRADAAGTATVFANWAYTAP